MDLKIGSDLAKRVKAKNTEEKLQQETERKLEHGIIDLLGSALRSITEGFNNAVEPSLQITLNVDGRNLLFRRKSSTILWVEIGTSAGYFGKYGPKTETDRTYFTIGNNTRDEPLFQLDAHWHSPGKYATPFNIEQFALLLYEEALQLR
jgi:hypothetical protein